MTPGDLAVKAKRELDLLSDLQTKVVRWYRQVTVNIHWYVSQINRLLLRLEAKAKKQESCTPANGLFAPNSPNPRLNFPLPRDEFT